MRSPANIAESFTCKSLQKQSGGTRTRTGDTMIFSHVLYQLSYPASDGSGVILRYGVAAIKRLTSRRASSGGEPS